MDSTELGDPLRSSRGKAVGLHNVAEQQIAVKKMSGTSGARDLHFNSHIPQEQGHHCGGYDNHTGNWGKRSNYVDVNKFNAIPRAMYNVNSPFLFPHGCGRSQMACGQFPPRAPSGFLRMSCGLWLSYRPVLLHGPQQVTSARPPSQDYVDANNFNAIPWAMYNDYSPFLFPHGYGRSQMAYGQFLPRAPFLFLFPIMRGGPWLSLHQLHSSLPYYPPVSRGPQHVTSACPPSQAELFPSGSRGLGLQTGSLDTSKPTSSRNVHPQPQGRHRSGDQNVPQGPKASKSKGKSSTSGDRGVESTSGHCTDRTSPNFKTDYERAKFFVIKSFNEDNIHRSIRHNTWASTKLGSSILDAAYREAKEGKGICPVFLFFTVNTRGKFVGIAEMVGPVDFRNIDDGWMGYGWNGQFPVKWHIIKDVPSYLLKDIVLENNEDKPVTHSRNAQEVELKQGIQMLEIFKNYDAETSLIQDLPYYDQKQLEQIADKLRDALKLKSDDRF